MNPPAFQFYADDFIGGVADMTQSEVGAYILLLCHQWSRGEIPNDPARASLIAKGEVTAHVLSKFPNGKNERMERVRAEREAFIARQRNNGLKGMDKRWHGQAYNGTITELSPKDNEPITSLQPKHNSPVSSLQSPLDVQTNKGGEWPTLCEVKAHASMVGVKPADAEAFWHHFESAGWVDKNGNPIIKWQSKLMGWKVKAAEMAFAGATKPPGSVSPSVEAIQRGKELEEVNKLIAAMKQDGHMELDGEDRKKLKELRNRQKELKAQLGWKV
jgi:uncharacterized protein YdaU (DUF1376 family)